MGLLTFWYALSCNYEHEPTLTTYILSQMERLHQMNVIPDVLPDFHPSFDMRLTAPDMSAATHRAGRWKSVEPGSFVPVISVSTLPSLYRNVHCSNLPIATSDAQTA